MPFSTVVRTLSSSGAVLISIPLRFLGEEVPPTGSIKDPILSKKVWAEIKVHTEKLFPALLSSRKEGVLDCSGRMKLLLMIRCCVIFSVVATVNPKCCRLHVIVRLTHTIIIIIIIICLQRKLRRAPLEGSGGVVPGTGR